MDTMRDIDLLALEIANAVFKRVPGLGTDSREKYISDIREILKALIVLLDERYTNGR